MLVNAAASSKYNCMTSLIPEISIVNHDIIPFSRRINKCVRGHDFIPENITIKPDGKRSCRLCRNSVEGIRQMRKRHGLPPISLRIRITHCKRGHEFTSENTTVYRGHRICKTCKHLTKSDWKKSRDKVKTRHADRKCSLKKNYGMTIEQYDALLLAQSGVCAICSKPPVRRRLDVDHCHSTGAVRGLLCEHCNKAIGLFRDNIERLSAAITYLSKQQKEDAPSMAT